LSTLFVIASETLRSKTYLGESLTLDNDEFVSLSLCDAEFVSGPEVGWADSHGLMLYVAKRIAEKSHERIRVAGHMGPCFGHDDSEKWQERLHQCEAEIETHLTKGNTELSVDLQVWGFRHEAFSYIWKVLDQYARGPVSLARTDFPNEQKLQFIRALWDGFVEVPVFERLSLAKHKILHLFLPTKMNLQTARELQAEGRQSESQELVHSARAILQRKLTDGQSLLQESVQPLVNEYRRDDKREGLNKTLGRALQLLQSPPLLRAAEFDHWLNELDTCLNELREATHKEPETA